MNPVATPNDSNFKLTELKDIIQDCNINFLIGSGISVPYLKTLGSIEQLLTETDENKELAADKKKLVRVSLYKKYFDDVITKNIELLDFSKECKCDEFNTAINNGTIPTDEANLSCVLGNYKDFLRIINSILLNRKSTILSKQINIFTTNIDLFLEKSFETSNVEYNDGFCGRFDPIFDLGNFKKSYFKKSLHYDNTSELPVFNLMKVHGSLTWRKKDNSEDILFSPDLVAVKDIKKIIVPDNSVVDITALESSKKAKDKDSKVVLADIISEANNKTDDKLLDDFLLAYERLSIVNPTKEKFKDTVLNQTYYELLRIFSNELEKENTVLFVMGFSFADEHIRKVTVRAANSNPTLKIFVLAHTSDSKISIKNEIEKSKPNNKNIVILSPEDFFSGEEKQNLTFQVINKVIFNKLLEMVSGKVDEYTKEEQTS